MKTKKIRRQRGAVLVVSLILLLILTIIGVGSMDTTLLELQMTGSYQLLLPAVWVCGLTFLFSRRVALYQKQVLNRALSPAHKGEYVEALLEDMTVADIFEPSAVVSVGSSMPLLPRSSVAFAACV